MEGTSGNARRWAMVVLLLSSCSAFAFRTREGIPGCRQDDDGGDSALYEEARDLGITDAVRASKLPTRQQRRVAVAIVREARIHSIDPLLVVAVIRTESAFNNYAVSPVGAMGLMQVMPSTAQWLSERLGSSLERVTNLFDSELNIALGTAYLAELLQQFKQVDAALLAYNAGPVAARRILADRANRRRVLAGYPRKVLREHEKLEREAGSRPDPRDQAPIPDAPG